MKHKCKRVFKHLSVTMIKTAMKKLYYQYCNIYRCSLCHSVKSSENVQSILITDSA